jgi:hypothetical protein
MQDKLISIIHKNSMEQLRVSLTTYKGHHLLDARTYFEDDRGEWRPTKKGLTVKVEMLSDILKALGKAMKEARAAKLLKE